MFVAVSYNLQSGGAAGTTFGSLRKKRTDALQDAQDILDDAIEEDDDWTDNITNDKREGYTAFSGTTLEIDVVKLSE